MDAATKNSEGELHQDAEIKKTDTKPAKADVYIAAIVGAFILVLADLCTNIDAAMTLKLGFIIKKYIIGEANIGSGVIGLLLVLLISTFFCWVYRPKDRIAAFARGL